MPSKMEAPESAKTITVYVNGEQENGDIIRTFDVPFCRTYIELLLRILFTVKILQGLKTLSKYCSFDMDLQSVRSVLM